MKKLFIPLLSVTSFTLSGCIFPFRPSSNYYASGMTYKNDHIQYYFDMSKRSEVEVVENRLLDLANEAKDYTGFVITYNDLSRYYDDVINAYYYQDILFYMYGSEQYKTKSQELYNFYVSIFSIFDKVHHIVAKNDFKADFYEGMSEEEIYEMIGPEKEDGYYLLEQELKAIEAEFDLLDEKSSAFATESERLYLSYVKKANELAKSLGYNNYLEYAYKDIYSRSYTYLDSDDFFANYVEVGCPLFLKAFDEYSTLSKKLSTRDYQKLLSFIGDNGFLNYFSLFENYKDFLGGRYQDTFNSLWYHNANYFISYEKGMKSAAFTQTIGDIPVTVFCDRKELLTIVHEFGHYYNAVVNDDNNLCYDLAETHSQGNEMLFLSYLIDHHDESYSDALVNAISLYQRFDTMGTIYASSLVNEIEKYAYLDDNLEIGELDQYVDELYTLTGFNKYDIKNYWRRVVMHAPCYYISYATSGVEALYLFNDSRTDFINAYSKYEKLIMRDQEEKDFLVIYEKAGLPSPFLVSTIEKAFK